MKFKIHQEKCYVDKRKLVLAFTCDSCEKVAGKDWAYVPHEYLFSIDGWGNDSEASYTVDGRTWRELDKESAVGNGGHLNSSMEPNLLAFYKHCVQAVLRIGDFDGFLYIDRRYEHNHSFDVYFAGEHYLVGKER